MVQIRHSDRRTIEEALVMGSGYVLDSSNRTFSEFFEDHGIAIYQEKYAFNGSSKANHMRAFIEVESASTVCRVLRELWAHREGIPAYIGAEADAQLRARFFAALERIESGASIPRTDAIERFAQDETMSL